VRLTKAGFLAIMFVMQEIGTELVLRRLDCAEPVSVVNFRIDKFIVFFQVI